jgi:four helix bundle protein
MPSALGSMKSPTTPALPSQAGVRNLRAYQLAEEGGMAVFELTKRFPPDEKYRDVDQLRRSSSSVMNNIAESYHRRSKAEKTRLLQDIAKGEAEETRQNLIRAKRKSHISAEEIDPVIAIYDELMKVLSGYINFIKHTRK